jgi:hypothetical protein
MEKIARLDRVSIFGGTLSFLIPHEWIEENEGDDNYFYHEPETNSGWLRVTLITFRNAEEEPAQHLKRHFEGQANVNIEKETGNMVRFSGKNSEEKGVLIHSYNWMVANVIVPDLVCEAVFSYTVLLDRVNAEKTRAVVRLIGDLVSQADFSPPI